MIALYELLSKAKNAGFVTDHVENGLINMVRCSQNCVIAFKKINGCDMAYSVCLYLPLNRVVVFCDCDENFKPLKNAFE